MDLLKKEYVANIVTQFDLRLSEGEITLYADCLSLVINKCSDNEIAQYTECENKEELSWFRDSLVELLRSMENKEFLPDRYK